MGNTANLSRAVTVSGLLTIILALTLFIGSSVLAVTIHVPSEQPTIQAGIDAASENDTILVADGVYKGDGNYDLTFGGKNLVVRSEDGPDATTIDCDTLGRAFTFVNSETAMSKVIGFSIKNGWTKDVGGAIYCDSSMPIIQNCIFSNNQSGLRGGAIYAVHESYVQIVDCEFYDNYSGGYGAGVYLHYGSDAVVTGCRFERNLAVHGGAFLIDKSTPTIERNLFIDNHADGLGGAIFIQDDCQSVIKNCTFANNYGTTGAVLYAEERYVDLPVDVVIANCILYGNKGDDPIVEQGNAIDIQTTDIFANEFGDWIGSAQAYDGINDNFSADPMFCDTASGDYHINSLSPCAPYNHPGYELVGALGMACGPDFIAFDIKPGSCPNSLNVKNNRGKAVLPAAIMGSDHLDVHDIDPSTITLLGQSPVRWSYEDVGTAFYAAGCDCSEEGPDGMVDLALKFDRNDIVDTLTKLAYQAQMDLKLNGLFYDEAEFFGIDCVRLVRFSLAPETVSINSESIPMETALVGNSPNPFNPTTMISYDLSTDQHVTIEIYNMLGQRVTTLVDRAMPAGNHTVEWDASNSASGIYLYRLVSEERVETKKMLLLK